MAIEKLTRVTVTTPKGDKRLTFKKYGLDESDRRIPCTDKCPYALSCELFPHPEHPENPVIEFSDFCGGLGQEDDGKLDLVPLEGSLERSLKDIMDKDHFQKFIELESLVKIGDVIDTVCSSGWCDLYKPDHSGCTSENKSCIIHGLLKNKKLSATSTEAEKEEKKEEDGN